MSERVLICGDRNWTDREKISAELAALWVQGRLTDVCHGAARGADTMAGQEAASYGASVTKFPADWKRYGKAAGPIRNRQMLKEFRPTLVLAFHDSIETSRGTADMVKIARAVGIPTFVFKHRASVDASQESRHQ